MTKWVVGTLSVMGPCWCLEQTHLLFLIICIYALSPALPMDPGEQVLAKNFIPTLPSVAGGAVQEFHHRQRLHSDLLFSSLPKKLPAWHHLHKVSQKSPQSKQATSPAG